MKRKLRNACFRLLLLGLLCLSGGPAAGAQYAGGCRTLLFAHRDTCDLYLDLYEPCSGFLPDSVYRTLGLPPENPAGVWDAGGVPNGYTVVFVFGGGFVGGQRDVPKYLPYFDLLSRAGFRVVSIDYRLGLKGQKLGVLPIRPLENAVRMATEDLYAALEYLLEHKRELGIDPDRIILAGSSAGAITVLQADYLLANRSGAAAAMPEDFRFAGVLSYAGAVFSREGRPDYRVHAPSPTCFWHGMDDRLVTYNRIRLGRTGFFGSSSLVKRFGESPYRIVRYRDLGHEAAGLMVPVFGEAMQFVRDFVMDGRQLQVDQTVRDPSIERTEVGSFRPSQLSELED